MLGRTLSHYRIVGQLGAGGMGVVYSAEDVRLGRKVALKFVSEYLASDQQAVLRLRSEARAASALNHPNICTIYDIGEDDGHPFIVMELMKGQTLRDRLAGGPLKVSQVVDFGVEIADALHAAHGQGIIHRDIKPGNIFVTERGHVKILDFGLAKLTSEFVTSATTGQAHTSTAGVTQGTPAYMSPEQATGDELDGRSDLFSLGVVLYECATGHHPFPGKTSAVIVAAILDRAPTPPSLWTPELPARLNEIISNCLEKDRELRYQSAADLRADLKRLRRDLDSSHNRPIESSGRDVTSGPRHTPPSGTGSVSRPTPISSGRAEAANDQVGNATPVPVQPRGRLKPAVWIAGATALLALVIAGAWVLRPREAPPQPQTGAAAPAQSVSTEAQITLAAATLKAGNHRAALAYAREVLALDPAHAEAARIERVATEALARFDEAIAEARRRLAAGDFENAAAALEEARALDPSSPSLVELSGRLADAVRQRNARLASTRAQPAASGSSRSAASNPPPGAAAGRASTQPPVAVPAPLPAPPAANPPPAPAAPAPSEPTTPVVTTPSPVLQPQPQAPAAAPAAVTPSRPTSSAAVPGTAAAPSDPPARTPAAASETDESMIRDVIATYARAIERKDLALFRSIKPNLTRQEERRLEEGFRAVTSQRVTLSVTSLSRNGDRASVVVQRRDIIEAGGRQHTSETQQVLTLSRTPSGWVIVDIR